MHTGWSSRRYASAPSPRRRRAPYPAPARPRSTPPMGGMGASGGPPPETHCPPGLHHSLLSHGGEQLPGGGPFRVVTRPDEGRVVPNRRCPSDGRRSLCGASGPRCAGACRDGGGAGSAQAGRSCPHTGCPPPVTRMKTTNKQPTPSGRCPWPLLVSSRIAGSG